MPRVKNLNGTAHKSCNCSSWLAHWKKYSGSFLWGCSTLNCANEAEVGAHVKKTNEMTNYIIPLCRSCNNKAKEFTVGFNTTFAPANIQKTCGK